MIEERAVNEMEMKKIVAGIGVAAMALGVAGATVPVKEAHAGGNVGDSIIKGAKLVDDDTVVSPVVLGNIPLDD